MPGRQLSWRPRPQPQPGATGVALVAATACSGRHHRRRRIQWPYVLRSFRRHVYGGTAAVRGQHNGRIADGRAALLRLSSSSWSRPRARGRHTVTCGRPLFTGRKYNVVVIVVVVVACARNNNVVELPAHHHDTIFVRMLDFPTEPNMPTIV